MATSDGRSAPEPCDVPPPGDTHFDAHCHIDFEAFDPDRPEVLARARADGVTAMHLAGVRPEQWRRAAEICATERGLGFSVGMHPWFLVTGQEVTAAEVAEAAEAERAEAIGELGLDAPAAKRGGASLDEQAEVARVQLAVARELGLPVVLHVVGAHGRMLELLRHFGTFEAGGMVHGYSGPAELVPAYVALGLSLGFGGPVTRTRARRARASVVAVPAERLLLESDAPDQPVSPGARGTPSDVVVVSEAVAELRGVTASEIAAVTRANAERLFRRI